MTLLGSRLMRAALRTHEDFVAFLLKEDGGHVLLFRCFVVVFWFGSWWVETHVLATFFPVVAPLRFFFRDFELFLVGDDPNYRL